MSGESEPETASGVADELLDLAEDAIMVRDLDGKLSYWNQGAERLYGWSREEAIGTNVQTLLQTQFPKSFEDIGWHLVNEGHWEGELVHRARDGRAVTVVSRQVLRRDDSGRPSDVLVISNDITARKNAEASLLREAGFVKLLQTVAVAANEASTADEAIKACLDEVCRHTGWPLGHCYLLAEDSNELVPTSIWHLEEPDRFGRFVDVTERTRLPPGVGMPGRVLASGQREWVTDVASDFHVARAREAEATGIKAAFAFPVLVVAQVVGVLEFFSTEPSEPDEELLTIMAYVGTQVGRVVERSRAERALRASEQRFRALAESALEAIVCADSRGRITYFNQGAERTFGYSSGEVTGKPVAILMPERFRRLHQKGLDRFLSTGESRVIGRTVELTGRRKDGTEFPVELSLSSWQSPDETFFSGIVRDVTDRKAAAEALVRQAEELARSNAELEQFAYVASHDLQEPLAVVAGYLQLLEDHVKDKVDPVAEKFLRSAGEGARRMQQLIEGLLVYSRVGTRAKGLEPVDCESALNAALENLHGKIEESDALITHDPLPIVMGDESDLVQLFQNLLGNAIKFRGEARPVVHVSARREPLNWRFSVHDNGIGIDPSQAETIFEMFHRLPESRDYPGTGIGLAICKKIVERYGGSIWVESAQGGGASFFFALPAAQTVTPGDDWRKGDAAEGEPLA